MTRHKISFNYSDIEFNIDLPYRIVKGDNISFDLFWNLDQEEAKKLIEHYPKNYGQSWEVVWCFCETEGIVATVYNEDEVSEFLTR